jgi:hypothetical protein
MAEKLQPSRLVAQLAAALGILADAPAAQLDWLARYLREARARTEGDFAVEELALQLEDAAQALPQFLEDGLLLEVQVRAVANVTEQLSVMREAGHAHLWQARALESASEWATVRARAKEALVALTAPGPKPTSPGAQTRRRTG